MKKKNKIISIKKFMKNKITNEKIQKKKIVLLLTTIMVISLFISGYSMGKGISKTKINSQTRCCKTYFGGGKQSGNNNNIIRYKRHI